MGTLKQITFNKNNDVIILLGSKHSEFAKSFNIYFKAVSSQRVVSGKAAAAYALKVRQM